MTRVIRCTAASEPDGYFDKPAISAQLGADYYGDPTKQEDEDSAQKWFGDFLEAIGTPDKLKFATYFQPSGQAQLTLLAGTDTDGWLKPISPDPELTFVQPIKTWLGYSSHWATNPAASNSDDGAKMPAGQLLAASEGWASPVPQRAGLTRVFTLGATADAMFIIPFWDAAKPPASIPIPADPAPDQAGSSLAEGENAIVLPGPADRGEFISTNSATDRSLLIAKDGFVTPTPNAQQVFSLLSSIAETAGSSLMAAPQLAQLSAPKPQSPQDNLNFLIWRGLNGALSLLDPVILALLMPPVLPLPKPQQAGPFLGALIAGATGTFVRGHSALHDEAELINDLRNAITGCLSTWETDPAVLSTDLAAILKLDLAGARTALTRFENLPPRTDPSVPPTPAASVLQSALATLFVVYGGGTTAQARTDKAALEADETIAWLTDQLERDLRDLAASFEANGGAERTVTSILDKALPTAPLNDGLEAFKQRLNERADAKNSANHAVGALVQREIVKGADPLPNTPLTTQQITDSLKAANWSVYRFGLSPAAGPLKELAEVLPTASVTLPQPSKTSLISTLTDNFLSLVQLLEPQSSDEKRFVPIRTPPPLPVMIAIDQDLSDDGFSQTFDGLSLLIKRTGDAAWAYHSLATIINPPNVTDIVLIPERPVATGGFSELFVNYNGLSYTWAGSPKDRPDVTPHFIKYAGLTELKGMAALPALAYGCNYLVACAAVSRSGALPINVGQAGNSWLPDSKPEVPKDKQSDPISYRRQTAISGTVLDSPRTGFPDVRALADDYPRVALASPGGGAAMQVDLWRSADGSGALKLADLDVTSLEFNAVQLWGGRGELKIELWTVSNAAADYEEISLASWTIDIQRALEGEIGLEFERAAGAVSCTLVPLSNGPWSSASPATAPLAQSSPAWVRLTLSSDAGPIGVSFADPAGKPAARTETGKIIVLPPDNVRFTGDLSRTVTISPPPMSFADFQAWTANPKLRKLAGETEGTKPEDSVILNFVAELLTNQHVGTEVQQPLPDLAVSGMLVELCPYDTLQAAPSAFPKGTTLHQVVDLPGIADVLGKNAPQPFETSIANIAQDYPAKLEISAGKTFQLTYDSKTRLLAASIPEGCNARISVRPLVAKELFEPGADVRAFDPRYAEIREGEFGGHYVFAGPAIVAEIATSLPDKFDASPADQLLSIRTGESVRGYDLVWRATAQCDRKWRHFSTARLSTQRWRYLGMPIYRWFKPRDCAAPLDPQAAKAVAARAVVRLAPTGQGKGPPAGEAIKLVAFELDAFAGRDDPDDQIDHQEPLLPFGSDTLLQSFPWAPPSATMFRHRVALISRYAAIMKNAGAGVTDVYSANSLAGDWLRAVVLADLPKTQLTRPQLRELLPLGLGIDKKDVTPPVLAVLDEPPLSIGGLAERIAAEVRTSLGYAFHRNTAADPLVLGLADARKEAGPDPRYSYCPTPALVDKALTLGNEGPLGFTYEADASAPAFPNSALLLTPRVLNEDVELYDAAEHFLSIALRRYLDPAWVAAPAPDMPDQPAAGWIEVSASTEIGIDGQAFLHISRSGDQWEVSVEPRWILKSSSLTNPVTLALCKNERITAIALLNQLLEPGRYATSIFAITDMIASPDRGPAQPMVLASFDWQIAQGDALPDWAGLASEPVAASPITAMNWTRTRSNAATLSARAKGHQTENPAPLSDLFIRVAGVSGSETLILTDGKQEFWPRHAAMSSKTPLHVHRHILALTTKLSGDAGRPLELHQATNLILGRSLPFAPADDDWSVRFCDLEVPARIMVANPPQGVPEEFLSANFDIQAISKDASQAKAYLAFIRLLGSGKTLKAGSSIAVHVVDIRGTSEVVIDPKLTADRAVEHIILRWNSVGDFSADFVWADGEPSHQDLGNAKSADPKSDVVSLSVKNTGAGNGEWWSDVSLLVLDEGGGKPSDLVGDIKLRWDWIFTGDESGAADAVKQASLRSLIETQARIVNVTPPLRVRRDRQA